MIQIFALLIALFSTPAAAQCIGIFPNGAVCGNGTGAAAPAAPTLLGAIPYLITGGTVSRKDAARWVDNAISAPDIGVDCTGVADSTSAIQTWVNAHLTGGHLSFPFGCQAVISSTITVTDGINLHFSSETLPGQGPAAILIWKGGNGGTSCNASFASCKYMFDFEHTDHPTVERLAFSANEAGNGWIADSNCPDGFLKFDGNPVSHIGTAGHVLQSTFANNCVNPNFVAINISQTALNNHENYYLYDNIITCSVKTAGILSHDGVSNGTTTLTAASGPFAANNVGRRIRISHAGGEFNTTVAAFVSSTQVTLAAAVPWSDTAQTLHIDQGYGIGIRNGASQNALQQVIYKVITQFCEVGILQQGGNMSMDQPTGTSNDFGVVIGGFTAQNTYVDFGAAEGNLIDTYVGSTITTPVSISHMRWSNGNQSGVGYVAIGSQVRITDSFPDFGPQSANSNFITPSFTYKINSIGTVVGGSSYTSGTYTSVPMLFSTGVSGAGNDYGVKATVVVAGGAVTTVTITTPGTFFNFPLPVASGFVSGGNIVTWSLTADSSTIGGTGTGFSVPITSMVTNTVAGNVNLFSANNNWSTGGWTYSQIGFSNFAVSGSTIVTLNDLWDTVTQLGDNQIICSSNNSSITGPGTCNKITNNVSSGLGLDVVTNNFTGAAGHPAVGYRSEGGFGGSTISGFQAIPSSGRLSASQIGFESAANLASTIDLGGGLSALYGFIARSPANVAGGSLANSYGLYSESQKSASVTTGWGVYTAGATDGNFLAGNLLLGNNGLTVPAASLGMAKIAADGVAPGAAGGKIELVCGTNVGTAKLIAYAGTSSTPVTILDNIGSGVTGC